MIRTHTHTPYSCCREIGRVLRPGQGRALLVTGAKQLAQQALQDQRAAANPALDIAANPQVSRQQSLCPGQCSIS